MLNIVVRGDSEPIPKMIYRDRHSPVYTYTHGVRFFMEHIHFLTAKIIIMATGEGGNGSEGDFLLFSTPHNNGGYIVQNNVGKLPVLYW